MMHSITPALRKLRQEDPELDVSLGYRVSSGQPGLIARSCLNNNNKKSVKGMLIVFKFPHESIFTGTVSVGLGNQQGVK
jgi:hypothetical protein